MGARRSNCSLDKKEGIILDSDEVRKVICKGCGGSAMKWRNFSFCARNVSLYEWTKVLLFKLLILAQMFR